MTDPTWNDQDSPARGTRTDDPRVEDPRLDDPRVEDPRAEDPRLEHPRAEDPRVEHPRGGDPRLDDTRIASPNGDATNHAAGVAPTYVTQDDSARRDDRLARNARVQGLGGIRWGAVFFGWVAATGVSVILVALVAATGTAIGLTESTVDEVITNAIAVSLAGAIALIIILAISYLAGGYVAARMARFSGRTQGFAVWVFGLVVTLLATLGGVMLGSAYDVLARLDLPRVAIDEGTATTGGVLTLVVILATTLLAAVVGGALGDRYHRRLDEIDLR